MKLGTIGHVDHGKTTLTAAIESVLEKQNLSSVYLDVAEKVFEFTNPYDFLNTPKTSKSRLKKCAKGFHEFIETRHDIVQGGIFTKKWECQYCGKFMHER